MAFGILLNAVWILVALLIIGSVDREATKYGHSLSSKALSFLILIGILWPLWILPVLAVWAARWAWGRISDFLDRSSTHW